MKKFKVAFASNDGYAEHLAVAIYSLLKNLSDQYFVEFIILDGGISEKNKKLIETICGDSKKGKVSFILMNRKKFDNLPVTTLPQETYYRLDLPELLFNDRKILYLDVDIIINGDISELFEYDIGNNVIGAVREISGVNYYSDDYGLTSKYGGLFFNCGILILNLEKMRQIGFKEKFYRFVEKNMDKLIFQDQDIFNAILENKRASIPPKFNALPFLWTTKNWKILGYSKQEFLEAKNNPVIIHFASKKPWNNTCYHPLEYFYHKYRKDAGLEPILKQKKTIGSIFEKYYSRFGLILISNLPRKIFRLFVYKPLRFFQSFRKN